MDKADAGAGGPGWLWLWRGSLWCSRWWQVSLPAVCQPWPAASCESGRGEWGQLGSERAAIQQAREMLWDLREQADVWPGWVRINFQKLQLTWSKFFSGDVRGNFSSFCCLLLSLYTNTSLHTLLHNMILFLTWFEKKKKNKQDTRRLLVGVNKVCGSWRCTYSHLVNRSCAAARRDLNSHLTHRETFNRCNIIMFHLHLFSPQSSHQDDFLFGRRYLTLV